MVHCNHLLPTAHSFQYISLYCTDQVLSGVWSRSTAITCGLQYCKQPFQVCILRMIKNHISINTEVSIKLTFSEYLISSLTPRSSTSVRGSGYTDPSQNLKATNENIKQQWKNPFLTLTITRLQLFHYAKIWVTPDLLPLWVRSGINTILNVTKNIHIHGGFQKVWNSLLSSVVLL